MTDELAGAAASTVAPAMPILPARMVLSTEQHLRAIADPMRSRILVVLQHETATAKQLAVRLGAVPGTIAHHMQVLEAAGLVQIVARRLVHGIQAKYYARSARIFVFAIPPDVVGVASVEEDFLAKGQQELAEALVASQEDPTLSAGFPHVRLTASRARYYADRLDALVEELLNEPLDPGGDVYGFVYALFRAPPDLQPAPSRSEDDA
ncbi:MAG: winged helix-turn-helix transcriptional regulator [Ktedonobacterales bacterium]|nr:winged helix-turn-helix transcriptional regulator [Ktedonobacterales bacterium]